MKNLKLNKLAENRLNEKEMRSLMGGVLVWEINCVYNLERDELCCATCGCLVIPPFTNTSASNGGSTAASAQRKLA